MLTASFSCFRGVGEAAERRLWRTGCLAWCDLGHPTRPVLSPAKHERLCADVREAEAARAAGLPDYFLNRFPAAHRVRVLHEWSDGAAFLDIETTGLNPATDQITTVAVHRAGQTRVYVAGVDLAEVLRDLAAARLLVTYNGTRFDLPFLRRRFGLDLGGAHLDLLPVLHAQGWRGGQKATETRLGIVRPEVGGLTGADAVALWHRYTTSGDREALSALVRYNAADAHGLALLAARAYRQSMAAYPMVARLSGGDAKTPVALVCSVL